MRRRASLAILALVLALTTFSVMVIWPDQPHRYLPGFVPWPSGNGLEIGDLDRKVMRLGLDLKGGTYVLLEADTSDVDDVDQALGVTRDIIEGRVNRFGVSESEIQIEGENRIAVQLPGIEPDEARELVGKTAQLEFREPRLGDLSEIICRGNDGTEFSVPLIQTRFNSALDPPAYSCATSDGQLGEMVWDSAVCRGDPCGGLAGAPLTGRLLRPNAAVISDPTSPTGLSVTIEFDREGGVVFDDVTGRLTNFPLGIFLDDELVSAPIVQTRIPDGRSVINGLEVNEAQRLVAQLNAGALPLELRPIQETEIDATLGDDTLRLSVQAGIIGILAVMAFMILYYRLPGLLAALALGIYGAVVLMIFKIGPVVGPVTITLAGIAAFVLSVGMAVDANILVFERMKEELRIGRSLRAAVESGFNRAWTSIRDSNVATLIICIILWWFGDQFNAALVKGFALTLGIGVVVSMFSAIIVTRTFLRLLVGTPLGRRSWPFGVGHTRAEEPGGVGDSGAILGSGIKKRSFTINFVRRRHFFYLISLAIIVPGVVSLLIPPSLKPGIEFSSGATFTVGFEDRKIEEEDIRGVLDGLGHSEARVQQTGEGSFIVRTNELSGTTSSPPVGPAPSSERDIIEVSLIEELGPLVDRDGEVSNGFQNFNSVSEIVSREIGRDATFAVLAAAGAILLYITFQFRNVPKAYRYGFAALLAVGHDTLIILGVFSILGKAFDIEINTMFITGLLTIIGFSVHDTIVVFDRLRENVTLNPDISFHQVVNGSLTETFSRSLNTSITLLFTILALLLLGGSSINSFLLVLLIGVIAGTYSSIFVATQLLVSWESGDSSRLIKRLFPAFVRSET